MYEEFQKYLKVYKPNQVLIKEGESNTEFYCLLHGSIGIWKGNPDNEDNIIKIGEINEKGTYFGEMSCLLEEPRSASIIAMDEPVKVLEFPGKMLPNMIVKQPKLGLKLCTAMANRLKGTTVRQQDIAIERNEIRDDATSQFLHAKAVFQKVFVMLTSIQARLMQPDLKSIIEYMSTDKLLQGGRKVRVDKSFLEDIPNSLVEQVKDAYKDFM